MSFQNKRVRIMSRPTVLRRILSNGDDRQADRLAQTLPLRRPGERPGHFLSLSDRPPLHSSRHPLLLHHLFYFRPKHPPVLFCFNNSPTPLSTLCKHRWRLIFVPPPPRIRVLFFVNLQLGVYICTFLFVPSNLSRV